MTSQLHKGAKRPDFLPLRDDWLPRAQHTVGAQFIIFLIDARLVLSSSCFLFLLPGLVPF